MASRGLSREDVLRRVLEDVLTFRGQNLVERRGMRSTATVELASALPPRRLKPTVRIQTPVSLTSV